MINLLRLQGARGEIAALEYEPRRPRNVAIVAGHGYSSSKQNLDLLCAFLASHGFHVVSVDFPGHKLGASGGTLRGADDLLAALAAATDAVQRRDPRMILALGHSMGAMTALRFCAADPRVSGAVSIATGYGRMAALDSLRAKGAFDLRSSYVDGLSLPEVVEALEPSLDSALAALTGKSTLFVAASRDMMVTEASVRELYDRAPEPKTLTTIESDHTTAADHSRAAVLAWLNEIAPRLEASV